MDVRAVRWCSTLLVVTLLVGCGEPEGPPPTPATGGPMKVEGPPAAPPKEPTPADRTKARLEELFTVVRAQVPSAAAPFVVYRGKDPARRWKDVSNYADEEEAKHVDAVFQRAWNLLVRGTPRFLEFRSEKESEGTWLVWTVAFGEGDGATKAELACLEVKGTIALGDIDTH
jgi:hypothetical protein